MNTKILSDENVLMDEECPICYNNFINVKDSEYNNFLKYIKNKYSDLSINDFENETCLMIYDEKFKCPTCNNSVCRDCVMKSRQGIVSAKYRNIITSENGIRNLTHDEIKYIEEQGYDIRNIVGDNNQNDIWKIPDFVINGVRLYGFMRGTPGEDFPVKCPFCRKLDYENF